MAKGFAGERIVVGITGSIAAFKAAGWVSSLSKEEARVAVIMTDAAQKFITPLTFAALCGEAPYTSMFSGNLDHSMSHIELAQSASVFLIAPASAQTIARLANGIADDLLSTAVLATRAPVIICPAMNSNMYLHPATQENIQKLKKIGYTVVDPESGMMACKDQGPGRLPEWEVVQEVILRNLGNNDLDGQKVMVTAGPTREPIDPARFISNRSSGKMGYALARTAYRRGADVVLISGPTSLETPFGVKKVAVTTAQEMHDAVMKEKEKATIIIKSAAVSDFRTEVMHKHKVKKDDAEDSLKLVRNPDILLSLGLERKNKSQILVGFAAESRDAVEEGRKKLEKKNLDLIVVNEINSADTGFEADTNKVTLLSKNRIKELPLVPKLATADMIWDYISQYHPAG